jgi:hypothetical protein
VIDLNVFSNHLFMRPQYQHYYFGDYYAANYRTAGYYPGFSINTGRFGYDPIYAHNRWQNRQNRGWERQQESDFQNRRDHEDLRPPHTWAAQGLHNASDATSRAGLPRIAGLLGDMSRSRDFPMRFQPVDQAERQRLAQHAQDVQRFREERQKLEVDSAAPADVRNKDFVPGRVKLPGSPIAAKSGADLGKDQVPPKIYAAPKPDPKVVAKPRASRSLDQPQPRSVNKVPLDRPLEQPAKAPPLATPQPKAEKAAPQPNTAPAKVKQQRKVEKAAPQPNNVPAKVKQQQPKPEKAASQRHDAPAKVKQQQPKAEKTASQPHNAPAEVKQEQSKDKDKGKDKN